MDASEDFLTALKGVNEPEKKRKIIGEKFIRTFEKAQRQVIEEAGASGKEVKFLVQGTLYPDVVESGGGDGAATSSRTTMWVACRTTSSSSSSSHCAPYSRMRFVRSVPNLACRTKSSGVSRSLARASASASSARSPRSV